jgi:site-specific DNA-methyltransferase (adenine-specific)
MSLEINKTHLMNSIEGMTQMDEGSVDLVVTSPPYDNLRSYNDSSSWNFDEFKKVADGLIRVLKPGGVIAWNVADAVISDYHGKKTGPSKTGTSFRQCLYFQDNGLNFHDELVYRKHAPRFAAGKNSLRYSDVTEYVFILSKGRPNTINLLRDKPNKGAGKVFKKDGGRNVDGTRNRAGDNGEVKTGVIHPFGVRENIWYYVTSFGAGQTDKRAYEHPALMPMNLAGDLIKSYSKEGDLVMDPFMGSGTTARMAYQNDRNYIGFEVDPTYHELCEKLTNEANQSIDDQKQTDLSIFFG